eukprot:2203122-Amphidinium_carterae.1
MFPHVLEIIGACQTASNKDKKEQNFPLHRPKPQVKLCAFKDVKNTVKYGFTQKRDRWGGFWFVYHSLKGLARTWDENRK